MGSWRTWLLTLCAVSCVFSVSDAMGPSRGGKWHVGGLTQEQLYRDYPEFAKAAERYAPKEEVVRKIKGVDQKVAILVFLGTWCPHSRTEVPKLLKVCELAANPNLSISMFGLGPDMKDVEGLAEKYNIRRVATFLFLKEGRELGRIVEFPKKSMEEDCWGILSGSPF